MTTLRSTTAPQPLQRPRLYWAIVDTWVLFQRSVHQIFNAPGQLIAAVVQPILLTVLMTILFGKAIHTDAPNYVSFIVPGILIGSALQVATVAMISVTSDMTTGMIDRFR